MGSVGVPVQSAGRLELHIARSPAMLTLKKPARACRSMSEMIGTSASYSVVPVRSITRLVGSGHSSTCTLIPATVD